ncbi:uncharacterized protein LOC128951583 [Oppia nitens]|uniref:uncharacterized protein LOC128951583 n=1 Tax=Oppia nitens TaxID=1686743 RepID=UPI0023DBB50A|nr:uncharacterized protein LOC128951583 [Oppia nitens]
MYKKSNDISFGHLLKNLGIWVNILITINAGAIIGFNTTTLELHLHAIAKLKAWMVGLIFLSAGIALISSNYLWEWLAHSLVKNKLFISMAGCIVLLIGLTIIGPIPIIDIKPQLYLVIIAQVLLGLGISALLVGTFTHGTKELINCGYPQTPAITALLSTILTTFEAFGDAAGSIFGGYLFDEFSYGDSSFLYFGMQLVLVN